MIRRNTVDGILSSINKSLSKLATVADQQRTVADAAYERQHRALVEAQTAETERERALRVHAKLSDLVN